MLADTTHPPGSPVDGASRAAALVDQVVGLLRVMHAAKAQAASRSAHGLLFPLVRGGPQRLSALAGVVHTDPSTTSRQVSELVREGLVERRPDPDDGRAVLLVVTDEGHRALADVRTRSTRAFERAVADWDDAEIAAFSAGLARFRTGMVDALGLDAPLDPAPLPPQTPHPSTTPEDDR